ncbi:Gti1/Pac2 family-domain-containing protein [Flagelloscypha sp. PMI_526]|nr:Gti1/Pac2 family-domain-containing protein [Flagelloscypha sp. PMI_526]
MPASAAASAPAPPFTGFVRTTLDALLILEAARRGIIPRITRRLVEEERKMIGSGSVFVFDEDESGIKRWTDGCFWSPSRILGNFLIYRETERKASATKRQRGRRPNGGSEDEDEDVKAGGERFSRPRDADSDIGLRPEKVKERSLLGSLTNSSKFKMDGLMKKTFSLTINGITQHLISYYRVSDIQAGRLRCPSTLPELASLSISPEYLDSHTPFRNPPKIEVDSDGVPHYRGEADESLDVR